MLRKAVAGLFIGVVAVAAVTLASVALGANVLCVAGSETCDGTDSADTITGSIDDDNIFARGGPDQIDQDVGEDRTIAGRGDDFIDNDPGEDRVVAGAGRDFVNETGFTGPNNVNGGPGGDCVGGSDEGDTIRGSGGSDRGNFIKCGEFGLYGFDGPDRIFGGKGIDRIRGNEGGDLLSGGKGGDYLDAKTDDSQVSDTLRCGPGFDRYSASPGDSVAPDCEKRVPPPEPEERVRRW